MQNLSIGDWTSHQVARWLVGIRLEHHIPEFTAQNIDGERLLQLESPELKVTSMSPEFQESLLTLDSTVNQVCFPQLLGVTSSQDRALIKKKIKDLKVSMEKAKRNQEKLETQREKLRRRDLEQEQKASGSDNAAE